MAEHPPKVTLKDVAHQAGVSVGMAGRVLGSYGSFSEATRLKVMRAARRLGYRRNAVARSLRTRRTHAIGVLISDITTYHWTMFVCGVEEAAKRGGYRVILCNTQDDPKLEQDYLRELHERNIDGIIGSPVAASHRYFRRLAQSGFPMALVNCALADRAITRIGADDRSAAADATRYLTGLGHRRIGLVAGAQAFETGVHRLEGYRAGLAAAGLATDPSLIAYGDYDADKAYAAAALLLAREPRPSALIVCSELMTGGVLRCLRDHRLAIPDDISLVAFDDPLWASFYNPPLTTLREPRHYMGRLACEALLGAIEAAADDRRRGEELMLKSELVIRHSCRAYRSGDALPAAASLASEAG
jgi:LacI family transcriptional regulator